MSAHKFTPGPWAAFTDDYETPPHTNIVALKDKNTCVFSLPGRDKKEADVMLISAAPELLEALEAFILVSDLWMPPSDITLHEIEEHRGEFETLSALHEKAREAIAKALGIAV